MYVYIYIYNIDKTLYTDMGELKLEIIAVYKHRQF